MTQQQQGTRTQLTDLPEIMVELSESELRIVSGGARTAFACYAQNVASTSAFTNRTDYITGGDHDSD
jgi:hypothetical protein